MGIGRVERWNLWKTGGSGPRMRQDVRSHISAVLVLWGGAIGCVCWGMGGLHGHREGGLGGGAGGPVSLECERAGQACVGAAGPVWLGGAQHVVVCGHLT